MPLSRVYKEELDIILPYRAKDGRRIMICCVGKWNPSKASIHELLLTFYAELELIALEPKTQVGKRSQMKISCPRPYSLNEGPGKEGVSTVNCSIRC